MHKAAQATGINPPAHHVLGVLRHSYSTDAALPVDALVPGADVDDSERLERASTSLAYCIFFKRRIGRASELCCSNKARDA
jgi:hypothetical protein